MDLPHLLKVVATSGAVSGLLWVAFDKLESLASEALRASVATWLSGDPGDGNSPIAQADDILVRVFGPRHFTWRCFAMSCAISAGLVLFGSTVLLAVDWGGPPPNDPLVGFFVFVGTLVADYASLGVSRRLVTSMRSAGRPWMAVLLLANAGSSLVITAVAYLLASILAVSAMVGGVYWFIVTAYARTMPGYVLAVATFGLPPPWAYVSVMFYTSMATSFWAATYVWSAWGVRGLTGTGDAAIRRRLANSFDVQKQPIRCIGALGAFVVFLVGVPLFWYALPRGPN
jgi:hypothetical protein